jgi:dCMP deaminase
MNTNVSEKSQNTVMTNRFVDFYMNVAYEVSKLSYCEIRKVGCIIVDGKGNNILSFGFNGTPRGFDNNCECDGRTLPEVLHAESNAITKLAKCSGSSDNAMLFTTTCPCIDCAKLIIQAGISVVYFSEDFRSNDGLELLKKANIKIEKWNTK